MEPLMVAAPDARLKTSTTRETKKNYLFLQRSLQ
jgi:hypothetical protein